MISILIIASYLFLQENVLNGVMEKEEIGLSLL